MTGNTVSPFLEACAGGCPSRTPIWLMRQAGRILPEYRRLRAAQPSIGVLFDTPELAARVTVMPVEQLGVDAAILFTDLVTPLKACGVEFAYAPGPVLACPPRSSAELGALPLLPVEEALGNVLETVRLVRRELTGGVPLIGYAGSPLTLASWLIEGAGSRDQVQLRRMLCSAPALADALLARMAELVSDFTTAQVEAGAQAIQIFDTSVGVLSPDQYRRFGLPHVQTVFSRLTSLGVPRIYFALAAAHLLPWFAATGANVLSLDWRTPLAEAYQRFGTGFPLQGNLDPSLLFAPRDVLDEALGSILAAARGKPHIFNLGHGVLPDTELDAVRYLIGRVHAGCPGSGGQR